MFWDQYVRCCNSINKSPSAVAKACGLGNSATDPWKNGATPRDSNMRKIANYFGVPIDFFKETGIFASWDDIVANYSDVFEKLRDLIPPDLMQVKYSDEKYLVPWLDDAGYFQVGDEIKLAKWFYESVSHIVFSEMYSTGNWRLITIEFTPSFRKEIQGHVAGKSSEEETNIRLIETKEMTALINLFCDLNAEGRERLLEYADDLVQSGKYKKADTPRMDKKA